ncbi:extracellular solute-binding protein family 1 (plasmid) [Nostoc sp. NIES-3756]|uniref:ABC transporter substrate-binding protein n=1 Tax=Nostoc sp. NIES-3756 TaxID=1751286 RepID=UPI000720E429|nr:ABC transporter substrate-binding protein [Nostoc sp. NIES-3756]BAT56893.1 extracellular solute-binding protein family 1 [Nostoc sp. NIES-3756]
MSTFHRQIYQLLVLILSLVTVACSDNTQLDSSSVTPSNSDSKVIKLLWDKGFTVEEDEALKQLISSWEKQSGYKIEITFYTNDGVPQKTQRAIQAGNPPDILVGYNAQTELDPRFAWEGKLVDVSDVIESVKNLYPKEILESVYFYNKKTQKRSYYAVPLHEATIQIFYWRDLLKQAGWSESDIPKDWNGFWNFWKQVQIKLRSQQKQYQNIYGLGFTYSLGASDTYYMFEAILEAYDVKLLDEQGRLLIDDPQVRQGIIKSLEWYAKFYQDGYAPPDSINWLNPDNNRSLLNRGLVMTPNSTLSIPVTIRLDRDTYNKLGILEFPNKPNGKPMRYPFILKEAVLFAKSRNQKAAKDFLTYLIQPKVMSDYLKAVGGRHFPVLTSVRKDPFWSDPTDLQVSSVTKILTTRQTRPYYTSLNPAYSIVLEENVWGKALQRILIERVTPTQAADEAISRIKEVFTQWQLSGGEANSK